MSRIFGTIKSVASELVKMFRIAADPVSFFRFAGDVFLYRVLHLIHLPIVNKERRIRLRGDILLTYRLNRGDIQSIREVWLDEVYQLPFASKSDVLIDLGANIGLTSVWLAKRYGYSTIIAVEPSPTNVRLIHMNLENNNLVAEVIEAAIGPTNGTVYFEENQESNLGRVSSAGKQVQMLSMQSVLRKLPMGVCVDLVKLDIEGGEGALLTGDLSWLQQIRTIIAEFHPDLIDYPQAIERLRNAGYSYIAAGSVHRGSMDAFVREVGDAL